MHYSEIPEKTELQQNNSNYTAKISDKNEALEMWLKLLYLNFVWNYTAIFLKQSVVLKV